MIAVTIGVGEHFAPLAHLSATSCRERTGLETHVLTAETMDRHKVSKPHHLKFKLFEEFPSEKSILYFDADTIFLQDFDASKYENTQDLVAVRDFWDREWIVADAKRVGISPREYFNSGLLIMNRENHATMLHLAAQLTGRIASGFHDQTYLNAARAWLNLGITFLPKENNYLELEKAPDIKDIIIGHFHWIARKPLTSKSRYYQYWQKYPITDTADIRDAKSRLMARDFVYERVGFDDRRIRLLPDGRVGEGAARCEALWRLTEENGEVVLWLGGEQHPTCALTEGNHGVWSGRWLHYEEMPVHLRPVKTQRAADVNGLEVVIINWRRPANVREIVQAFSPQRKYCRLTIIEAASDSAYELDKETLNEADRHFVFSHNFGSFNRYIVSLGYTAPYTYFHDDDLLPGENALEYLLECSRMSPEFAALGQFGRILAPDGQYIWDDVPRRADDFVKVDFLVRAYFVVTENLRHMAGVKAELDLSLDQLEDDLLLCCSISLRTSNPCLLMPNGPPSTSLSIRKLPEPDAVAARADHMQRRLRFLERMRKLGWNHLRAR